MKPQEINDRGQGQFHGIVPVLSDWGKPSSVAGQGRGLPNSDQYDKLGFQDGYARVMVVYEVTPLRAKKWHRH
jgi:hypothetical protein